LTIFKFLLRIFKILFISHFVLATFFCAAQSEPPDTLFILKGQIVSSKNGAPIPYAHVINLTYNSGTFSDTSGIFRIWVKRNDVLKVTAVGFYDKNFFVVQPHSLVFQKITLIFRSYNLPRVDIKEKLTKEVIEYQMVHGRFEKDQIDKIKESFVARGNTIEELKILYRSSRKTGISLNFKSSADIQNEKLSRIIEREKFEERALRISRQMTNLSGEALQNFVNYCHFLPENFMNLSDYEMSLFVRLYYQEYKKIKK
jgi:hypothetical protein